MNVPTPVIFLLLLLFVAGCSKFEEGPAFSLRSVENRLHNRWHMIGVTDNVPPDSLFENYTYLIGDVWSFDAETLQIEHRLGGIGRFHYRTVDDNSKIAVTSWNWVLGESTVTEYKILRLTGRDLKLVSETEPQFTLILSNKAP